MQPAVAGSHHYDVMKARQLITLILLLAAFSGMMEIEKKIQSHREQVIAQVVNWILHDSISSTNEPVPTAILTTGNN